MSIQNSTQDRPEQFTELVKSGIEPYTLIIIDVQVLFLTDFKSQVGQLQSEQFKVSTIYRPIACIIFHTLVM